MTDEEYVEPTNEQLANFLIVYANQIPGTESLMLSAPVLESLMSQNPRFREGALRHHREFQRKATELAKKLALGQLRCLHIRPNGQQCKNFNVPGSMYCGIPSHNEEGE
jgi:hypothetical protein